MKTNHLILIVVIALLIVQVFMFVSLKDNIGVLDTKLNSTKGELQDKINENYMLSQGQLSDLRSTLVETEKSLSEQVSEIKATTSADFSGIIETVVEGIVSIKTDVAQGSGFIITSDGYIVTNTHVLAGAHFSQAITYDSKVRDATLIGYSVEDDIALLKIEGEFDYLKFGDSDDLKVGEKIIAVGNPYGLSFSVSEGIISALNRVGLNNKEVYIQTDVALNPGNSGGPMINTKGKVVGVNNFKITSAESLGFAMESNYAEDLINDIALKALHKAII